MHRPTSVNIISWVLIVSALVSLAAKYLIHGNPVVDELMSKSLMSHSVQNILLYGGLGVTLVAGIAMRQGRNWGRMLYVGFGILGLIVAVVTSPVKASLLPGALLFTVIAYFLFRPKANAFFSPRIAANDA